MNLMEFIADISNLYVKIIDSFFIIICILGIAYLYFVINTFFSC